MADDEWVLAAIPGKDAFNAVASKLSRAGRPRLSPDAVCEQLTDVPEDLRKIIQTIAAMAAQVASLS